MILVHSGRLTSYEPLHFGLKSMLGRLAVPFFYRLCQLFPQTIPREFSENEGLSGQNRKTYLFGSFVYLPYAWLFSPSCLSLSSRNLDCSGLLGNVLPTLVYSCFLLGLFLVNQLVKRLGMVWTG